MDRLCNKIVQCFADDARCSHHNLNASERPPLSCPVHERSGSLLAFWVTAGPDGFVEASAWTKSRAHPFLGFGGTKRAGFQGYKIGEEIGLHGPEILGERWSG